jgi:hypothetical protein
MIKVKLRWPRSEAARVLCVPDSALGGARVVRLRHRHTVCSTVAGALRHSAAHRSTVRRSSWDAKVVLSWLLCGASAPGGAHETTDTDQASRFIPRTSHHTSVIAFSGAYRGGAFAVRIAAGGDVTAAIPTRHCAEGIPS